VNEMTFTYASYSEIGMRDNNEDACAVQLDSTSLVAIVADGVGGHINGEIASNLAVKKIPLYLAGCEFDEDELGYAILKAHTNICETHSSACTTVAALWLSGNKAIAAHVGDSRIYQFRNGNVLFQSEDHSLVQVQISLKQLPKDACRNHRDRNKVYNVLGDEKERPTVSIQELDIQPGDRFLLCSDGFWEPVTEELMLSTIDRCPNACDWLEAMKVVVSNANNPKQDNHTAVVICAK
jgi:serine/threonine protein phosphatase PrpC